MHFNTILTTVAFMGTTSWAQYVLEDDYFAGSSFFDKFSFFTEADPTHGFVDYIDQSSASGSGLISVANSQVYMGVDSTNVATSAGRQSVRITSNKAYNSGLVILDLEHMPGGICGTWPAFWMVGPDWPLNGEIDIIEGVNEQTANDMTLHTGPGCTISDNGLFSGEITTSNCDINAAGQGTNAGCQIITDNTNTYGSGFNANRGGVYATEWTGSAISVYFFPRGSIPSDITNGSPNPSGWGMPLASFQGGCDIASTFKQQQIVFDTTFCGDWAGSTWSTSSCSTKADTCNAFVQNNPSAFTDAYWTVNSLKVYQVGIASSSSALSSTVSTSATSSTAAISTTSSVVDSTTTFSVVEPTTSTVQSPATNVIPTTTPSTTGLSQSSRTRTGRRSDAENSTDALVSTTAGTTTDAPTVTAANASAPSTSSPTGAQAPETARSWRGQSQSGRDGQDENGRGKRHVRHVGEHRRRARGRQ